LEIRDQISFLAKEILQNRRTFVLQKAGRDFAAVTCAWSAAQSEGCFRFFSDPRLRLGRPTHISDFRSCECESRPHDCGNGSGATV